MKKFHVTKETFSFLRDRLYNRLFTRDTKFRSSIPVGKKILIALTVLKSNADFSTVADLFGVGKSTVGHILFDFCSAVVEELSGEFICFPKIKPEIERLVQGFWHRWQFPGSFGAIDGSHIPIKAPTPNAVDYYNYKNFYSIVLMAVVDFKYKFL